MKKNYIAPMVEIEMVETQNSLLLTVSMGNPFGEGEDGTADVKNYGYDSVDNIWDEE